MVLAAGAALVLGVAPSAHADGGTTTPVTGLSVPAAIAAADFDGNRYDDLAIADGTDLVVVRMPGVMTKRVPQGTAPTAIATGDLDHDGRPDVATPWGDVAVRDTGVVRSFIRDPAGTAYARSTDNVDGTGAIAGVDLDGDAKTDLAVISGSDVALLLSASNPARQTLSAPAGRRLNGLTLWRQSVMPPPTAGS